jgi:hypothetical protein
LVVALPPLLLTVLLWLVVPLSPPNFRAQWQVVPLPVLSLVLKHFLH